MTESQLRGGYSSYPSYSSMPASSASIPPPGGSRPVIISSGLPAAQKGDLLSKSAPFIAEFIGTLLFVFTSVTCSSIGDNLWNTGVRGFFLYAVIYAFCKVSGGLVNPAVSLSCALSGKIGWGKAFGYSILQVLGAICGGSLSWLLVGPQQLLHLGSGYQMIGACLIEMFSSMVLCLVFQSVAALEQSDDLQNHLYGFVCGCVIIAAGYTAGPVTGGIVNPAISVSFPLLALQVDGVGIRLFYALFQTIGAVLAFGLSTVFFRGRGQTPAYPAAESMELESESQRAGTGIFVVRVHDVAVQGLRSKPTIVTRHGNHQYLSTRLEDSTHSSWGGLNDFVIPAAEGSHTLSIDVVDAFNTKAERSMGAVVVDLRRLVSGKVFRTREHLLPGQGSIEFEIRFDGTVNSVPLPRVVKSSGYDSSDMISVQMYGKLLAEFLGTFLLTFTIVLSQIFQCPLLPLAAAAAWIALYYCFVDISGAYFNPGVTVAMQVGNRGKLSHTLLYIFVQLLAGLLAGLLCVLYAGATTADGETLLQLGDNAPSWWFVIFIEILFSAILSYTYLLVVRPGFPFTLAIAVVQLLGSFSTMRIAGGIMSPALTLCMAVARERLGFEFPWWQLIFFFSTQFSGSFIAATLFLLTRRSSKPNY